jgi:hypothetical protein
MVDPLVSVVSAQQKAPSLLGSDFVTQKHKAKPSLELLDTRLLVRGPINHGSSCFVGSLQLIHAFIR